MRTRHKVLITLAYAAVSCVFGTATAPVYGTAPIDAIKLMALMITPSALALYWLIGIVAPSPSK